MYYKKIPTKGRTNKTSIKYSIQNKHRKQANKHSRDARVRPLP